jgi:hypothetical protein
MFNNPRSQLLSIVGKSEARIFSISKKEPLLPHLYVSPSKKGPRNYVLDQDQSLIRQQLNTKVYVDNSRGPGLAIDSNKSFK